MSLPPPHTRGNPGASRTSARPANTPPPANDVDLDAAEEALLDRALAATVPVLRRALAEALTAHRPRRPLTPRQGARAGDLDVPVDELTRARARALLARHGGRR